MKLYHGSNVKIEVVDLVKCKNHKDFGRGFYLTEDYHRASVMANRRSASENSGEPTVNPFLFYKSRCPSHIKIKEFKTNSWDWAMFILQNREHNDKKPFIHEFDIVIGPVADKQVDEVLENYKKKYGEKYLEKDNLHWLAQELKYYGEKYIQYCFCTEESLKHLIRD